MPKGIGLIVAGTEGVGKTTFAAEFPKKAECYSCPGDTGMEDLLELGVVSPSLVTNFDCTEYSQLFNGIRKSEAKTIIVDSLSGYEQLIQAHVCMEEYDNDFDKFFDYYKGPRQTVPRYVTEFCSMLENKRRQGQHVIVISHVADDVVKNPRGMDYTTTDLDLDKGARDIFKKWAANILFLALDPGIERVTKEVKRVAVEAKMKEGDTRVIFTQKSLVHVAKNKLGLPVIIPMGSSSEQAYDNFVKHLPPLYKEQLQD